MKTKDTKYTEEKTLELINIMHTKCFEDESIVFIQELFKYADFTKQRYSEMLQKYKSNSEIIAKTDAIKEKLEERVAKGALNGKYNATFAIFNLKNNY